MTSRLELINDLQSDMVTKLIVGPRYSTKIYEVRVGVFDPEEYSMLPSIGLWITEDEIEDDLMDNSLFRRLNLICYGYCNAEDIDTYENFYNFIADVEKFLYSSDNRQYKNTYLGNTVITYGGASEQIGLFVTNFSILYSQSGLES